MGALRGVLPGGARAAGWVVVAVVVAALPLVFALAFTGPAAHEWSQTLTTLVAPLADGAWRVLRGGLKWIMPPVLAVTALVCLVVLLRRRGVVRALVVAAATAGSFLVVEAAKTGLVPFPAYGPDGGRALSGHTATASSALLAVLAVTPARLRGRVAVVGAFLVTGAEVGVVVGRWHDTADAVLSVVVTACAAGVLGALAAAVRVRHRGSVRPVPAPRTWPLVLAVVCGVTTAALVSQRPVTAAEAVAALVAASVGASALLAAAILWALAVLDAPQPRTTAGDHASGTAISGVPEPSAGSDHTSVTPGWSARGRP